MAAIAVRHADGFNTQASHLRLGDLVGRARDAHAASGRTASRFIVTVFAGLEKGWLRRDSRARRRLASSGSSCWGRAAARRPEIRAPGGLLGPTRA